MSEHLSQQSIGLYRRREIDPTERRQIDLHLAVCDACLSKVLDLEHSSLAATALTEALLPSADDLPFHLSRDEIRKYLAGSAGEADRLILESHLEICEECSEEAQAFSEDAVPGNKRSTSFKHRLTSIWPIARPLTAAHAVVAIAFVAVLLFLAVIWQRSAAPQHQVVETGPLDGFPSPSVLTSPTQPENPPNAGGANDSIVISIKDNNGQITLDSQGKLRGLEGVDEQNRRGVERALVAKSLPRPKVLDELSAPKITLMGDSRNEKSFALIGPMGTVVSEQRPTLLWQKLKGASSYEVSVYDANFNRIVSSGQQARNEWTVPVVLARGKIYAWEVTALKDGERIASPISPAPRAQFKVLDLREFSELNRLRSGHPVSHLALGVAMARLGLVRDAEREFQILLKQNGDSELLKSLLRTVQSWQNR